MERKTDEQLLQERRKRVDELVDKWDDLSMRDIAIKYADLESDYAMILDLNKQIDIRFNQLLHMMPHPNDYEIIKEHNKNLMNQATDPEVKQIHETRMNNAEYARDIIIKMQVKKT